jgi:catechol 2,3-dioxygenase-like lactoylglutathione lyase family enzyme
MSTTWECLCLDVNGPALGEFWAGALGATLQAGRGPGDPGSIRGPEGLLIELNPVPEEQTVKNRVHLDVHAASLEELTDAGATILHPQSETGFGWTVLQDPEGGEFCAFLRDDPPAFKLHGIGVDCADPQATAAWWGEVFGVTPRSWEEGPWWTLEHATPDEVLTIDFQPVPEPKTVKNRIHWDVRGQAEALEAHGATRLWEMPRWVTLADPEGNEFCVFE